MLIGVDFDNTIVCYDGLFHQIAVERNLLPPETPATKQAVRDRLRETGREDDWTEMQGYVYGERMADAAMFPGAMAFFQSCRERDIPTRVISHKTRHPYQGPRYDLHSAARNWLEASAFFDPHGAGLTRDEVFFEETKAGKLSRIGECGCTHFIDDLPEFLTEASFPGSVERVLFDPARAASDDWPFARAANWNEIGQLLL